MEDHPGRVEDRRSGRSADGSDEGIEPVADGDRQAVDAGGALAGRQPRALVGHDHVPGDRRDRVGRRAVGSAPDGTAASSRSTLGGRGRSVDMWPSVAGTRGSRTHRAAPSAAPLVLKTRGPTGTRPLPARW